MNCSWEKTHKLPVDINTGITDSRHLWLRCWVSEAHTTVSPKINAEILYSQVPFPQVAKGSLQESCIIFVAFQWGLHKFVLAIRKPSVAHSWVKKLHKLKIRQINVFTVYHGYSLLHWSRGDDSLWNADGLKTEQFQMLQVKALWAIYRQNVIIHKSKRCFSIHLLVWLRWMFLSWISLVFPFIAAWFTLLSSLGALGLGCFYTALNQRRCSRDRSQTRLNSK